MSDLPDGTAAFDGTVRGHPRPAYERSFVRVPATVADLLGVDLGPTLPVDPDRAGVGPDVGTVVLVVVDGFGLRGWRRHRGTATVVDRLAGAGTVTTAAAVFPSETAAAMTSLHTGRPPVEHGLIGWNVYRGDHGLRLSTLPFESEDGRPAGEAAPDLSAGDLFEGRPVWDRLLDRGVAVRTVVPSSVVDGAFSAATTGRADRTGYDDLDGFSERLRRAVTAADGGDPAVVYAYLPQVDSAAHAAGTESPEYRGAVRGVDEALGRALGGLNPGVADDAAVVVTADHGMVDTDPATNGVVDAADPDLRATLRRGPGGDPVRFGGGPRNVHLYCRPDRAGDARRALADLGVGTGDGRGDGWGDDGTGEDGPGSDGDRADGNDGDGPGAGYGDALVLAREAAVEAGLFGPGEPSETFRRQAGDLVVVPRRRSLWHPEERDKLEMVGMHGGLARSELPVPVALAPVSALARRG